MRYNDVTMLFESNTEYRTIPFFDPDRSRTLYWAIAGIPTM